VHGLLFALKIINARLCKIYYFLFITGLVNAMVKLDRLSCFNEVKTECC